MHRPRRSCLSPVILKIEFEVAEQALGEVQGPQVIPAGQQSVEHYITDRCIGGIVIIDIIESEFSADGTALQDIVLGFDVQGIGNRLFTAI